MTEFLLGITCDENVYRECSSHSYNLMYSWQPITKLLFHETFIDIMTEMAARVVILLRMSEVKWGCLLIWYIILKKVRHQHDKRWQSELFISCTWIPDLVNNTADWWLYRSSSFSFSEDNVGIHLKMRRPSKTNHPWPQRLAGTWPPNSSLSIDMQADATS